MNTQDTLSFACRNKTCIVRDTCRFSCVTGFPAIHEVRFANERTAEANIIRMVVTDDFRSDGIGLDATRQDDGRLHDVFEVLGHIAVIRFVFHHTNCGSITIAQYP